MKNGLVYIMLSLLIVAVGYGGSGVSYMIYCCTQCQDHGLEVVLTDKCCETHEHTHTSAEHDDLCGIKHIEVDWNSVATAIPVLQPMVINLSFFSDSFMGFLSSAFIKEICSEAFSSPPLPCPRTYLSLLTVLII